MMYSSETDKIRPLHATQSNYVTVYLYKKVVAKVPFNLYISMRSLDIPNCLLIYIYKSFNFQ